MYWWNPRRHTALVSVTCQTSAPQLTDPVLLCRDYTHTHTHTHTHTQLRGNQNKDAAQRQGKHTCSECQVFFQREPCLNVLFVLRLYWSFCCKKRFLLFPFSVCKNYYSLIKVWWDCSGEIMRTRSQAAILTSAWSLSLHSVSIGPPASEIQCPHSAVCFWPGLSPGLGPLAPMKGYFNLNPAAYNDILASKLWLHTAAPLTKLTKQTTYERSFLYGIYIYKIKVCIWQSRQVGNTERVRRSFGNGNSLAHQSKKVVFKIVFLLCWDFAGLKLRSTFTQLLPTAVCQQFVSCSFLFHQHTQNLLHEAKFSQFGLEDLRRVLMSCNAGRLGVTVVDVD